MKITSLKSPSADDPDMSSQNNLTTPDGLAFPAMGSQQRISVGSQGARNKVQLTPGHSLMDWIRLSNSGKDLTGVGGRKLEVSTEELQKHNTEKDCWIALRGKVYNVSAYMDFHPGGIPEMMRGAGKDATSLFDEIHKWVNAESMLEKCLVGRLKVENTLLKKALLNSPKQDTVQNGGFLAPATAAVQSPRFDWFQSGQTVSVVVFTKWPHITTDMVEVSLQGRALYMILRVKSSIYTVHINLEKDVNEEYNLLVSSDSGKVELVLGKSQPDVQWSCIGKHADGHNTYLAQKDWAPVYRDCTVESVMSVTRDTNLYTLSLPRGVRMCVPIGRHVHVRHNVQGMDVARSYTAVLPSLSPDAQDPRQQQGTTFYLMVKIYTQGTLTPWIGALKPGDVLPVSSFDGDFTWRDHQHCGTLVMFAAGTGFTPMVRLIYTALIEDTTRERTMKLLFFNKTLEDILWKEQLDSLALANKRFSYVNCLSEPHSDWSGLQGRVTKEMVQDFLPSTSNTESMLIAVCGPSPFTKSVIQFCKDLGYEDSVHGFEG
ncbi:cytochrome b5 reductase 4-like isoform X3 [Dreissena polymorpha]|uniref:cytochrome b5 reductase 4-like isoform X3 n=1 Tax=Dreissena polymorpha TaxID=45954 RepID=UPI0022648CFE|nr:cytochrome b5 reductase 4-like isoform X3 [Dreissena polymorpha]